MDLQPKKDLLQEVDSYVKEQNVPLRSALKHLKISSSRYYYTKKRVESASAEQPTSSKKKKRRTKKAPVHEISLVPGLDVPRTSTSAMTGSKAFIIVMDVCDLPSILRSMTRQ